MRATCAHAARWTTAGCLVRGSALEPADPVQGVGLKSTILNSIGVEILDRKIPKQWVAWRAILPRFVYQCLAAAVLAG
jgi:hypothetical protein